MIDESKLAALLRGRLGVTTRKRLRAAGFSDRQITGLIARRRLASHGNGVLVDAASPDTFLRRVAIACAVTGGVACGLTAAQIWDYRKAARVDEVHVLVHWSRRVSAPPGVVVHRTTALERTDIVQRGDGVSVTSPPRTVFDLAGLVSREVLESIIEQALDRRMFLVITLWRTWGRLHRTSRRGGAVLNSVLSARPVWRKPSRSDYELRLERALRDRGFPELIREFPLTIAPGVVVHPDLGLPDDGFFVEVDHVSWHGGRADSAYDKRRDRKVRLGGSHVERVSDIEIDTDIDGAVDDLWVLWQRQRGARGTAQVHRTPDSAA